MTLTLRGNDAPTIAAGSGECDPYRGIPRLRALDYFCVAGVGYIAINEIFICDDTPAVTTLRGKGYAKNAMSIILKVRYLLTTLLWDIV